MTSLTELWQAAITWLATHAVTPTVHWLDIAQAAGDPREIAEAVLIAGLQLFLIAGVMRPLESLFPAERWSDRRLTTVNRSYTLLPGSYAGARAARQGNAGSAAWARLALSR